MLASHLSSVIINKTTMLLATHDNAMFVNDYIMASFQWASKDAMPLTGVPEWYVVHSRSLTFQKLAQAIPRSGFGVSSTDNVQEIIPSAETADDMLDHSFFGLGTFGVYNSTIVPTRAPVDAQTSSSANVSAGRNESGDRAGSGGGRETVVTKAAAVQLSIGKWAVSEHCTICKSYQVLHLGLLRTDAISLRAQFVQTFSGTGTPSGGVGSVLLGTVRPASLPVGGAYREGEHFSEQEEQNRAGGGAVVTSNNTIVGGRTEEVENVGARGNGSGIGFVPNVAEYSLKDSEGATTSVMETIGGVSLGTKMPTILGIHTSGVAGVVAMTNESLNQKGVTTDNMEIGKVVQQEEIQLQPQALPLHQSQPRSQQIQPAPQHHQLHTHQQQPLQPLQPLQPFPTTGTVDDVLLNVSPTAVDSIDVIAQAHGSPDLPHIRPAPAPSHTYGMVGPSTATGYVTGSSGMALTSMIEDKNVFLGEGIVAGPSGIGDDDNKVGGGGGTATGRVNPVKKIVTDSAAMKQETVESGSIGTKSFKKNLPAPTQSEIVIRNRISAQRSNEKRRRKIEATKSELGYLKMTYLPHLEHRQGTLISDNERLKLLFREKYQRNDIQSFF